MKKATQGKNAGQDQGAVPAITGLLGLDDLIQQGARQIIQLAIETELAEMLERYSNVTTISGKRTVVRNGYLPERQILCCWATMPRGCRHRSSYA